MLGAPEDPSQAAEQEPMELGDYVTRNQEYTDDEDDAAANASEQAGNSGETHPPAPGAVRRADTDHDMDSDDGFLDGKGPKTKLILCTLLHLIMRRLLERCEANYTNGGGGDLCLRPNFLHCRHAGRLYFWKYGHIHGFWDMVTRIMPDDCAMEMDFTGDGLAVIEPLQKENMQPRSGAATYTLSTNTLSTPEKELMMAKASNEKKKETRFDQKLRHSEQREPEKGKRRKCDLISSAMRSDAAQLLTEDNKAALRERIMSIMMHDD
eukprot:jgi/Tetstr1/454411/TSEL_041312.t1